MVMTDEQVVAVVNDNGGRFPRDWCFICCEPTMQPEPERCLHRRCPQCGDIDHSPEQATIWKMRSAQYVSATKLQGMY